MSFSVHNGLLGWHLRFLSVAPVIMAAVDLGGMMTELAWLDNGGSLRNIFGVSFGRGLDPPEAVLRCDAVGVSRGRSRS
ncbi:predicted protein [Streptomyces sp. AA4]|nr:predicted protein [Streptomyces sp. AA4]